jgi:hypothetical protein
MTGHDATHEVVGVGDLFDLDFGSETSEHNNTAATQTRSPFACAVDPWRDAGWHGILPLAARSKEAPPKRYTGAEGEWPLDAVIDVWRGWADANVCLRFPNTHVGIDVDGYKDAGRASWDEVVARCGPLPATWSIRNRDDGISGTYLFRLPHPMKLRGGLPGIDVIQHHHRYQLLPPSVHPDGRVYVLYGPDGRPTDRPPTLDEVPLLPDAWVRELALDSPGTIGTVRSRSTDAWAAPVVKAFGEAVVRFGGGESRHDVACQVSLALCRYEDAGLSGATDALETLGELFIAKIADRATSDEARAEWDRMVDGGRERVARTPSTYVPRGPVEVDELIDDSRSSSAASAASDDRDGHVVWLEPDSRGADTPPKRARRPRINVSSAPPRDLAEMGWDLLCEANDPERLFVSGGRPVRLERDDNGWPVMQPLTPQRTLFELSYVADWFQPTQGGGWKPVGPPPAVATQVLATPEMPLPSLMRLVEAPVFAPNGSLQTEPGYHPDSRTLYVPAPGFVIPPISQQPSASELRRAIGEFDELLCDFPFADDASRAHAVALMILPFVRDLIDGPTPLHLFDKPVPGSGASLLVHALLVPMLGHAPPFGTDSNTDEEWRKRITSSLMHSPTAVVLDNLTGELRSPALMAAITSTVWEDRILGRSEIGRWPIHCVWIATSNNLSLKRDLVRRTLYCRLDPNTDRPEDRAGFRHELPGYAYERRPQLVWAVLTAVQAWIAAGRPTPTVTRLGSFEAWTEVIGGILDVLEIDGFLGDRDTLRANTDAGHEPELWLIEEWWRLNHEELTTSAKLFALIEQASEMPPDLLNGRDEQQMRSSLGTRLRDMKDRVFTLEDDTKVRVTKATKKRGTQQWQLQLLR